MTSMDYFDICCCNEASAKTKSTKICIILTKPFPRRAVNDAWLPTTQVVSELEIHQIAIWLNHNQVILFFSSVCFYLSSVKKNLDLT